MLRMTVVTLTALTIIGCGGGGNHATPIPAGSATITGQVLTVTNVVAARAAESGERGASVAGAVVSSSVPVADAVIQYILDSGEVAQGTATTDANGNFTIKVRVNSLGKGTIRAIKGNSTLEATVDPGNAGGAAVNLAIPINLTLTVESTVANRLRKTDELKDVAIAEIIELVRAGEAGVLAQAVIDAFNNNVALTITDAQVKTQAQGVKTVKSEVDTLCAAGQTWCISMTKSRTTEDGKTKARVMLVQQTVTGVTPGTIGAGKVTIQWPGANVPTAIAPVGTITETTLYQAQLVNKGGQTEIAFVYKPVEGIAATKPLFDITLTTDGAATPATAGTQATVTEQKLRGVLGEKRSASGAAVLP